jgi:predicted ABC-type ATPase
MPQLVILAGPNGSGKSTIARALLPKGMPYLNADEIAKAKRQSPGVNVSAGRQLLEELDRLAAAGTDCAVETTLSGRALVGRLARLRSEGWSVRLFFLYLPSPDMAVARVRQRVRAGGHDIPEPTVRRRWAGGLKGFFERYQPLADEWVVLDNTTTDSPGVIAFGTTPRPDLFESMRKSYDTSR